MSRVYRTQYSRGVRFAAPASGPGVTKPEFAGDCDINKIVAKYQRTGVLPEKYLAAAARYGDFSQIPDLQTMHDRVMAADDLFMQLPSKVRKAYGHSAASFIEAFKSKEGLESLEMLGLIKKVPVKANVEPIKASEVAAGAAVNDPRPEVK